MYYYAYYDTTTFIVQGVYALPTPLSMDGYVEITQEQYTNGDLVGKIYNPDTNEFESPREWVCNTDQVQYTDTGNTTLTEKLNAIDANIANIQLQAGEDGASAYEIAVANGFEGTETQWLASLVGATGAQGEKGDKGDKGDTGAQGIQGERGLQGEQGIQGVKGDKGDKGDTGATGATGADGANGADGTDGKSAYQIALDNGFVGSQTEWLASLKGDKGDKGDAGESGTSASITADEVLTKIKTVDGAESGLDADMLDGIHASGFATADHTHNNYATQADVTAIETALNDKSDIEHTHPNYATVASLTALETEVDGKADANHIHTQYAAVDHTHTGFVATTTYTADMQGKADAEHTHAQSDITGLSTVLGGKANASHNHETSDIAGLDTALSGKANATHTHSINDISETTAKKIMTEAERTKLSGIETGANKTTVDNALSATSTNPVQNKVVNSALSGKANSSHSHAISDITNLQTQLDGKSGTSHSHNTATQTANGFISSADKTKLDGIATGANKTTVDSAMSSTSANPVQNKVINTALAGKANTNHTHTLDDVSETTNKKVMTAAERTKLSGVETGANKYTHPSTHAASMITGLSAVATSGKYSDLKNVPTAFTPSAHTHIQSDITGLATALNGKADANHTHDYCTLNQVYPVGSIYLSVSSANPSTLFGGTWVAFGTGKVLMGVKSGGSAEATGGSETATISAHTHTTASHKLTIEEMPPHHHEILNYNENGVTTDTFTKNSVEGLIKKGWTGNVMTSYTGGNQAHSHGNTGSAGAATINVVQPYITCYMWKRTA